LHGDVGGGKHEKLDLEKFWDVILTLCGESAGTKYSFEQTVSVCHALNCAVLALGGPNYRSERQRD
jgi:hypothetical protein